MASKCLEAFDRWPLEVDWAQSMGQLTLTHRLEAGCCENFPGWAQLGTAGHSCHCQGALPERTPVRIECLVVQTMRMSREVLLISVISSISDCSKLLMNVNHLQIDRGRKEWQV
jgi:hypothetical protein